MTELKVVINGVETDIVFKKDDTGYWVSKMSRNGNFIWKSITYNLYNELVKMKNAQNKK